MGSTFLLWTDFEDYTGTSYPNIPVFMECMFSSVTTRNTWPKKSLFVFQSIDKEPFNQLMQEGRLVDQRKQTWTNIYTRQVSSFWYFLYLEISSLWTGTWVRTRSFLVDCRLRQCWFIQSFLLRPYNTCSGPWTLIYDLFFNLYKYCGERSDLVKKRFDVVSLD